MSKKSSSQTSLDAFTGKYALSKTLRFELRVPKEFPGTQVMLEKENVFETGRIRREKYEEAKPWIDRLHREFIKDAFSDCENKEQPGQFAFVFSESDLESYHSALKEWQKDKKSKSTKKALVQAESDLRQKIVDQFNKTAKTWAERYPELKLKKTDLNVLFEAGIFRVLAERYKKEDGVTLTDNDGNDVSIFDGWKGWVGYFKKFFQTRKNFYSADDESTAVAYRVVNQNLKRFCENITLFEQVKDKIDIAKIERDLGISCEEVFSLQYYNTCFLQDGIDAYNRVLGGYVEEKSDKKVPGINQAINEYRQTHKGEKIKFLSVLDKQIHSEKDKFIDEIENDEQLLEHLDKFVSASDVKLGAFKLLVENFADHIDDYDLNKIYLSSAAFERNAGRWFDDYASFEQALIAVGKKKEWKDAYKILDQKAPDEKEGEVKYSDFLILAHIAEALEKVGTNAFKAKYREQIDGFANLSPVRAFVEVLRHEVNAQFERTNTDGETIGYVPSRQKIKQIIKAKPQSIDPETKVAIKHFADTALTIYQIAKYFAVEKKRGWLDTFELDDLFYEDAEHGYKARFYDDAEDDGEKYADAYTEIVKGYNALRNYLTKKPYNTDKWVLNFGNPTLADGWDKNKEDENSAIILRKDGRYYLGIMHDKHKDLFTDKYKDDYVGGGFEKMEYKYFPEASKMIPKCSTQLKEVRRHFGETDDDFVLFRKKDFVDEVTISRRVYDLNNILYRTDDIGSSFVPESNRQKKEGVKQFQKQYLELSKDKDAYRSALEDWIAFCIDFLKAYKSTSIFDFTGFKEPSEYSSLDEFYKDVNALTYSHIFVPVSESYISDRNNAGELFLFEIHNKDWNLKKGKEKTGNKNLHTLYWENLFSKENLDSSFVFKLNGEAELFFRPKTSEDKLGSKLVHGEKRVNHWRYAQDKMFFHCPITFNRVSEDKTPYEMNADIRKDIATNNDMRVIGIDRGEKNLAYYSVIDQDGKIQTQGSLNSLGETNGRTVKYAEILEKRAKDREAARREWQDIEQIKDTKKGFVSQMVREITDLAIEHDAIVVLEDLNMRFKQIRGGIEKSVYQQFEKQLIDKLSFVVNKKETDATKPGHPLRALQLASPIMAFKDMGKQTGIVFYTAAGYTSRTCPECGYRRNVRFQFETKEKAVTLLKLLDHFTYDPQQDAFAVTYSLSKMLSKEQLSGSKAKNKLYENENRKDTFSVTTKDAIRYKWIPNESPRLRTLANSEGVEEYEDAEVENVTKRGKTRKFNLTTYLKGIFAEAGIDLGADNLLKEICDEKHNKVFFEKFLFALFLLTETRQTVSGQDIDYIHCPECCFDSRNGFQGQDFNGDANGAYNIARKGIVVAKKIRQYGEKEDIAKMGWGELAVSIEEWDKFTQK